MTTTINVNLHDYIATYKEWQQLWADDDVAYWFESLNSDNTPDYAKGYKYQVNITTADGKYPKTYRSLYCKTLSQAFDTWNKLINNHLATGKI